jgi:hypothetical protein
MNTVIDRLSGFLWVSCGTYQYRDFKRWTSSTYFTISIQFRPVVFELESHPKQLTAIVKQFKHLFYPSDFRRSLVQSGNLRDVHEGRLLCRRGTDPRAWFISYMLVEFLAIFMQLRSRLTFCSLQSGDKSMKKNRSFVFIIFSNVYMKRRFGILWYFSSIFYSSSNVKCCARQYCSA